MTNLLSDAYEYIELIKRKAPEYLDILTSRSDEDFEKGFYAILENAISHLEANKTNFESLDEVGLSAVLVGSLSIPGLAVRQETHSNGHVDITIEANHCSPPRKKLGEAKIYDGPAYHLMGLQQLLGRYTTGREGRGLLIEYVRKRDIAQLVRGLRERMDSDLPCAQEGNTADHVMKWSFVSNHRHSCGDLVEVGHVGCNLFVEQPESVPHGATAAGG